MNGATAIFDLGANHSDSVGTVTLTNGSIIGTGTSTLTSTGSFEMQSGTVSAILAGSGIALNKTTGGMVTLSGANTFTGGMNINAGTVSVSTIGNSGSSSNLGSNGTINIGNGGSTGTLLYTGSGETTDKVIRLNGSTGGAIIDQSGTGLLKFTSNFTSANSSKTLTLQGSTAGSGEIAAAIPDAGGSGTLSVVKEGSGTWTFSGASANTYAGTTTVNGGTLILSKTAGVNAIAAGGLVIGDGAGTDTVRLNANNQIADASAVTVNSSGVFDLNGNSDTIGTLTMTGGSVTTGVGTLTLGGNVTGNAASTPATISGKLALGGNRTFTIADGAALEDMAISAVISGSNTVTKSGAGTLVFSGANTYTGTTTVSAGVLRVANDTGLGTVAGATSVASGGAIQIDGSGLNIAEALNTLSGDGGGGGALLNLANNNTWSGLITLADSRTFSDQFRCRDSDP